MGAIAGAHVIYVQGYLLIRLNESQQSRRNRNNPHRFWFLTCGARARKNGGLRVDKTG